MNYYKITNQYERHHNLQYHTGLNVDCLPFRPSGDCEDGGIYFARRDILAFLFKGPWLRMVTIPDDAQVYLNPDPPEKWKADKVILGPRKKITLNVIKRLIKEGADIHADNDAALKHAACNGQTETVKMLLNHGADIHADDNSALKHAACNGHTETVKMLLENGADVHADDNLALKLAAYPYHGHTETVSVLKQWMADHDNK